MADVAFYIVATLVFLCALALVFHRNPMVSALSMAGAMIGVGALYVLLSIPFLGFFQVIIYAGAVMVIVLYIIMALGQEEEGPPVGIPQTALSYLAALLFLGQIIRIIRIAEAGPLLPVDATYGTIQAFGKLLVETYAVPFELASLLLVGAMVGAVVLSRRKA